MAKNNKLTTKETRAKKAFLAGLKIVKRKTKKPVIAAIVGLVGSGKSTIAKELAKKIGGIIVEADAIRIQLRKAGERYEGVSKIGKIAIEEVIGSGSNAVIDSDNIPEEKRAVLLAIAKKLKAKLIFIRTYADYDIMAGRVISAKYQNKPEDFFGGASSSWKGSEQRKGAAVKLREMWRRTPQHYRWENKGGGAWVLKKLPVKIFAEIDTGLKDWKKTINKISRWLIV